MARLIRGNVCWDLMDDDLKRELVILLEET